jgi:MSHA pilin protein MshC
MWCKACRGFTLVELIAVMILVSVLSITLFSRLGAVHTTAIQAGRDDLIAALFFAQQQAMMRSNISLELTANSVSVNENGNPIQVSNDYYPLRMPEGVILPALTLGYDKLGRTTATEIVLMGSGNSSGVSATIQVDASGYAYAK